MKFRKDISYSISWNCFLIIIGSCICVLGLKGIAEPHHFVPGGMFGVAFFAYYLSVPLNPGLIYALINIPLFIIARFYISGRFILYSLLAMITASLVYQVVHVNFGIENQLYAAVAGGVVTGAGGGMVLRSLGSNGGLDIIAVILFQKFNIGLGKVYFIFNLVLYAFCFFFLNTDLVIASIIMAFVASASLESSLAMFNQRKVVFIISTCPQDIADDIIAKLSISSTFIEGSGAFSRSPKQILMTVINNVQLKRLEEIVFLKDDQALFIVENTFNVIGSSFSKRKIY
ncbi:MAG: YitT family protein [Proteobacteria bacterium]|nr:YitT family protein [Pseudomonadota bacterium]